MVGNRLIAEIFNKSQHSVADHPKLLKHLRKVYDQIDDVDTFFQDFVDCLKCLLIHGERQTAVNLCLDFSAKFATSFELEKDPDEDDADCHPFYEKLFDFILSKHNVRSQAVRFRVCQFINRLLEELSESASINAELFEKIYDAMLERIQDRIASVRVQAVVALQRLQDPTNKECPVIKALVFHLERDPHPEVRRAVLKALGCNYFTLEFVLIRLRDVKDLVRRQAYIFISERVHVRTLSIANRVTILNLGLNDKSPAVTAMVQNKLIPAWITAMEGSIFNFLRGLDVEGCSDIAVKVLQVWLKTLNYKEITTQLPMDDEKLVTIDTLKPEVALYWCTAVGYLHSEGVHAADVLETIMPEMTAFGKYVKDFVTAKLAEKDEMEVLSMEFTVGKLLEMAQYFDLADEAGRLNFRRDLCELLQNEKTSPSLTRTMVKCISLIEPNLDVRITKLLEVISELREPLTQAEVLIPEAEQRKNKLEIAQCRVQLNELKEELEQAVEKQNFVGAQEIKQNIVILETKLNELCSRPTTHDVEIFREERDDPLTLLKCLSIVCELLKNSPMLKLTKELDQLLTSLILPCVERIDPAVRNAAFEALGCLCTCDLELAQQRLLLFVQAVQMDHQVLQITTAKVLFDLVQLFGLSSFEDQESGTSLASVLTDLLDNEDADVQTIAVEGFAKLLIASRIESSMILSRLVIFLFHPLTEENVRLRQVLHVFFPFFASMDIAHQQQLESAYLPTIKTIQKAPCTSPLAEMDITQVVKFFVDLTQESLLVSKPEVDHTIHDQLALKLCTESLRFPDSNESKVYLKALLHLNMSFSNPSNTRDLHSIIQKMLRKMKERSSIRLVEQFEAIVKKHLTPSTEDVADSTVNGCEMEIEPVVQPSSLSKKTRTRMLGSKQGASLLMDTTGGSDAEISQCSDVFFSPEKTSTQKEKTCKKSPEVVVEQVDSSSTTSSEKIGPSRTRQQGNSRSTVVKNPNQDESPPRRRTRSMRSTVVSSVDEDDDVIPPTPPRSKAKSTRKRR
ncbi:condensin complex subunit 3-like [Daphnia carinata]|uniref:condensin complex subunit 3-like n=1 Tax=Daphnia carinata TaxID=120202 RepID=UPI0025796408|nr:condensin complex subunit 3-like [Daphnia carinata]